MKKYIYIYIYKTQWCRLWLCCSVLCRLPHKRPQSRCVSVLWHPLAVVYTVRPQTWQHLPFSLSSSSLFHSLPPTSFIFISFSCVLAVVYYIRFTFQPSFVSISRRQENDIPQKKEKKMFKGDKKPLTVIDLNVSF